MPPRPPGSEDLPERIARVYFRLLIPLIAVTILWIVPSLTGQVRPLGLVVGAIMLLFSALHLLRPHWRTRTRLVFSLSVIAAVAWLAAGPQPPNLGAAHREQAVYLLLLLLPAGVLTWHLLFVDRPWLGRPLALALTAVGTAASVRWETLISGNFTLPVLLLSVCLVMHFFGLAVARLHGQVREEEGRARRDALTGLNNRLAFAEVSLAPPSPGVLAVLDLDHFKLVNDRWGHEVGDQVLRDVAGMLRRVLDEEALLFRWGGEEFVVCLPGYTLAEAEHVLEGVRAGIAAAPFREGQHITFSGGLCAYGVHDDLADVFSRADAALRQAKAAGRNRILVAPPIESL